MDYSLPAWLGGLIGAAIAVVIYVPAIRVIERQLRAHYASQAAQDRAAFEDKLSLLRRMILGLDVAVCATAGYWIGRALGGLRG
jgi:hypothetical protein